MSEFEKDKNEEHKFGETARKIGETPTEGGAPANEPLNADMQPPEAAEKPSEETPTAGNESDDKTVAYEPVEDAGKEAAEEPLSLIHIFGHLQTE